MQGLNGDVCGREVLCYHVGLHRSSTERDRLNKNHGGLINSAMFQYKLHPVLCRTWPRRTCGARVPMLHSPKICLLEQIVQKDGARPEAPKDTSQSAMTPRFLYTASGSI